MCTFGGRSRCPSAQATPSPASYLLQFRPLVSPRLPASARCFSSGLRLSGRRRVVQGGARPGSGLGLGRVSAPLWPLASWKWGQWCRPSGAAGADCPRTSPTTRDALACPLSGQWCSGAEVSAAVPAPAPLPSRGQGPNGVHGARAVAAFAQELRVSSCALSLE